MPKSLQQLILETLLEAERMSKQDLTPLLIEELKRREEDRKVKPKYVINRTIKRLENQGMITIEITQELNLVEITDEGREKLKRSRGYKHFLNTEESWDGLWRVIILNFPEQQRTERDLVRRTLKTCGFRAMKRGLWVTPYECASLLEALRADFGFTDEVIFLTATNISPDIRSLLE
jgi:DNA-binding transcriptional regulator PaaX